MKFSGSLKKFGLIRIMARKLLRTRVYPSISLIEKYGWNGILSMFLFSPKGLFDPFWCKKTTWIRISAVRMKGSIK